MELFLVDEIPELLDLFIGFLKDEGEAIVDRLQKC